MRTGLIASSVVLGAVLLLAIFRYDIAMFAASRGVGWVSGGYFDLFENTAPELSEVDPGVYWFNTTRLMRCKTFSPRRRCKACFRRPGKTTGAALPDRQLSPG